eukprot:1325279-Pleurochrysis_carterae.AAC.1
MALTKVKLIPMPFTSITCSPACPVAYAEQMGRTLSGRGPGQRGSRSYGTPPRGATLGAPPPLRPVVAAAIAFLSFLPCPCRLPRPELPHAPSSRVAWPPQSRSFPSLPSAFLSKRSRKRARPSPASTAGRNLMISRPSLSPA